MVQLRAPSLVASSLLAAGCVAAPEFGGPLPVRNQHPAQLTVLHLPVRGTASLPEGQVMVRGDAAYSNLFLSGSGPGARRFEMDGEYLRVAAGMRAGLGGGLELGVEVPVAHTSGGFLDGFVIDYHDTLGLPDQGRDQSPRDAFEIRASRAGQTVWQVERDSAAWMDVPVTLAWQVADPVEGLGMVLQAGIELPTGDDADGYGNGQLDVGLGLGLEYRIFGIAAYGRAQHTFAGTPRQSRDAGLHFADVTSVGGALEVPLGEGVTAAVQFEWETSTLRELGLAVVERDQALLWLGGRIRLDDDTALELGFGEDLIGLVSPDFTAWIGMSWIPRTGRGGRAPG